MANSYANFAPILMEADAAFLRVEGALPKDLNGTLYRNGPNPQFESPGAHWYLGDGMLHAFRLENGRVSYRNRWVRTPKWEAEKVAGRALVGDFGRRLPGGENLLDAGVANTNIVFHSGKLLALEEFHLPTQVDPQSLETIGYADFGMLKGPFTAHPKFDPETGEMFFFGYNASGPCTPTLSFGVIDRAGRVTRYERFEAPFASMVHDFMVTKNYIIFPVLPLIGDLQRAKQGRSMYVWEPERGAWIGVMKRNSSSADLTWFRGESCYVLHMMNGWDAGDRIFVDVIQFAEAPLFSRADGSPTASGGGRLWRWKIDLQAKSDVFTRTCLDEETTGEFPRMDERYCGRSYSHGWFACSDPMRRYPPAVHSGIAHLDATTGGMRRYMLPDGATTCEPIFVPRHAQSAEGDGWVLSVVWRATENRSDLAVFDAKSVEEGPIALAKLDHRVPDSFHGSWVASKG